MATIISTLKAFTVTLTSANTNYRLSTLLTAIDATLPQSFYEIQLQSDPANANRVFVGDVNLSGSRMGISLSAGNARSYNSFTDGKVDPAMIYLRSDGAGIKVNVELVNYF